MGTKEIVNDYENGTLDIEEIEDEELPAVLKEKTVSEKKTYLEQLKKERAANEKKLKELSKKRAKYIAEKKKEQKDSTSFSYEVVKVLKKQAEKE